MFCVYPPHNLLSYRISFLRISLSLPFCVLFIGRVHGLPLWRAIDLKCCLSVCFLFLSLVWDGSTSFRYQMVFTILLEIIQDTYTNVYVQDTYTNVYRTHMHMHAYMHTYIHTLVGSGPLFPQSVLQCLCSCVVFVASCSQSPFVCVWSATVIITANLCAQVCMRHQLHVSTVFNLIA